MGQYYIPTLIAGDGTVRTLYSHQYDNGLKLMEHWSSRNTGVWHGPFDGAGLEMDGFRYHPRLLRHRRDGNHASDL